LVNRRTLSDRLARSTPELVVEKLATDGEDTGGSERAVYASLLETF